MCRNYDKGECAEPGCTGRVSCQNFTDGRCVEHSYNGRGGWSDDEDEDAAEGSTGAPLRQQIAEAIHENGPCWDRDDCVPEDHNDAADAVVALLNLTEEHGVQIPGEPVWPDDDEMRGPNGEPINDYRYEFWTKGGFPIRKVQRERINWSGPWLPSTPPDTSSSETT